MIVWRVLTVVILVAFSSSGLAAQAMTQQQADEMLKELRAIRQAIEALPRSLPAAPAAAPRPVDERVKLTNLTSEFTLGRADAPLTIVEFTDLQCPFCNRFATSTFDDIKRSYIDTGKVRFITRDLPLTNLHPHAQRAAVAARCAGEQKKFWEMRTYLVRNAASLSPQFIAAAPGQLSLDVASFEKCIDSGRFDVHIQKDAADAASVGITGTPSFVIGRTTSGVFEGSKVVGAQPFAVFDTKLKQLLADAAAPAPGSR